MREVEIRTGVWYNDRTLKLFFPDSWDVKTYWPSTPPPLSDNDINEKLNRPIGQPPLREMAIGKKKPIIVVDDITRPTPVHRILPFLLRDLRSAGIRISDVRILVATGTHGEQDREALRKKIGNEGMTSCEVIVHNDRKEIKFIGNTSFGTPVDINFKILKSDLLLGIGGVYPQHTTGFGGGSKLALGIMGRRSIKHLHFGHKAGGGNYDIHNDFRKDVTEIARMIGLNSIYTLHVNAQQEVVNLYCGDHFVYYPEAALFSLKQYVAPIPHDADVVIANAYPSDVYHTFLRKSEKPIRMAPHGATGILIASNHGGKGKHGLFPNGKYRWVNDSLQLYHRVSIMRPGEIISKMIGRGIRKNHTHRSIIDPLDFPTPKERVDDFLLFVPPGGNVPESPIRGMKTTRSWEDCITFVERDHPWKKNLRARIYPCASLQCVG